MSGSVMDRRQLLIAGAALVASAGVALAKDDTIKVTIKDLAYMPADIKAKAGTVIEWTNTDPVDHTATVDGKWDILIPAGKTATHKVTADDNVKYYCRFHPNMIGSITVES